MKKKFWITVGILGIIFLVHSCVESLSNYDKEFIMSYIEEK